MILTNRQQIYAKWRRSSRVFVLSTWQISLKGATSTSHLSPPEGKIRAWHTIEQPNQCLMNIFGCCCVPYDEFHQGKRYNLKSLTGVAIFSFAAIHLQILILPHDCIDWSQRPEKARLMGSFELILGLDNQLIVWWDESLQASKGASSRKMSSWLLPPTG